MDGRFSLSRYSIGGFGRDIPAAMRCTGNLNVVAGAAVPVQAAARFSAALRGNIQGTVAVMSDLPAAGSLAASVRMSANVLSKAYGAGALQSSARACKNIERSVSMATKLNGEIWASKTIPAALSTLGRLTAHTAGSKNIPSALSGTGALNVLPEAISQTTETARVLLRIPPGGELRLNSEFFTALLNGENVLYAQEGDWITLSDRVHRLLIESASGGRLEGQLIFTERYL